MLVFQIAMVALHVFAGVCYTLSYSVTERWWPHLPEHKFHKCQHFLHLYYETAQCQHSLHQGRNKCMLDTKRHLNRTHSIPKDKVKISCFTQFLLFPNIVFLSNSYSSYIQYSRSNVLLIIHI